VIHRSPRRSYDHPQLGARELSRASSSPRSTRPATAALACAVVAATLALTATPPAAAAPVADVSARTWAPSAQSQAVARAAASVFLTASDYRVVRRLRAGGLTPAAALAALRRHKSPSVRPSTRSAASNLGVTGTLTGTVAPVVASMVPTHGGVCSYWTPQWTPDRDWSGRIIPTRCGDATFGWTKIMTKHGIVNVTLVQRLYQQQATKIIGTQLEYDGFVIQRSDLSVQLPVRAVVETTGYSLRRGESSPDGMIMGTNTVYCMTGQTLCPFWINLL
jgi:hypothetical protein